MDPERTLALLLRQGRLLRQLDWLVRYAAERQVGDVWQGPSGRWFTKRADGRVVPAANPSKGTGKAPAPAASAADADAGAAPAPKAAGKPTAKGKAGATPRPSVDAAHEQIRGLLADPSKVTGEQILELVDTLTSMRPRDLTELKKRLGLSGTRTTELARRLREAALGEKPDAAPDPEQVWQAASSAYDILDREGSVKIPELFDAVREQHPGLTQEQFHKMLLGWKKDDRITLELASNRDAEKRHKEGIEGPKGLYFYVVKNEGAPAARPAASSADKPAPKAPASKPAPPPAVAPKAERPPASRLPSEQVHSAIRDKIKYMGRLAEYRDGLVRVDDLYRRLKRDNPSLTAAQLKDELLALSHQQKLELQPFNEMHELSPEDREAMPSFGRSGESTTYGWVAIRNWDDQVPTAEKPAPKAPAGNGAQGASKPAASPPPAAAPKTAASPKPGHDEAVAKARDIRARTDTLVARILATKGKHNGDAELNALMQDVRDSLSGASKATLVAAHEAITGYDISHVAARTSQQILQRILQSVRDRVGTAGRHYA